MCVYTHMRVPCTLNVREGRDLQPGCGEEGLRLAWGRDEQLQAGLAGPHLLFLLSSQCWCNMKAVCRLMELSRRCAELAVAQNGLFLSGS